MSVTDRVVKELQRGLQGVVIAPDRRLSDGIKRRKERAQQQLKQRGGQQLDRPFVAGHRHIDDEPPWSYVPAIASASFTAAPRDPELLPGSGTILTQRTLERDSGRDRTIPGQRRQQAECLPLVATSGGAGSRNIWRTKTARATPRGRSSSSRAISLSESRIEMVRALQELLQAEFTDRARAKRHTGGLGGRLRGSVPSRSPPNLPGIAAFQGQRGRKPKGRGPPLRRRTSRGRPGNRPRHAPGPLKRRDFSRRVPPRRSTRGAARVAPLPRAADTGRAMSQENVEAGSPGL